MPAKKSNPDARQGSIPFIGQALNGKGGSYQENMHIPHLFDAVNKSGSKTSAKGMKSIDGPHDVKTEVCIPSVKDQVNRVSKQMKANDKVNKKYRGDD